jgi:hypothetical protein
MPVPEQQAHFDQTSIDTLLADADQAVLDGRRGKPFPERPDRRVVQISRWMLSTKHKLDHSLTFVARK